MQVVVWILIILIVIFLIWILRRWIKRLIFILILLALAFLIYGIFNPSGAARLWYNVRTFPQRVASWMSEGADFLDYDSYKSKISSIGDEIGDKIGLGDDVDLDSQIDIDKKTEEKEEQEEKIIETVDKTKDSDPEEKVIEAFPDSIQLVDIPGIEDTEVQEDRIEDDGILTGYSKSDLFGIINTYLENNLDDDTDVLVTVEYEDDNADPQKIILQTQSKK